jgi:hypothetical protein
MTDKRLSRPILCGTHCSTSLPLISHLAVLFFLLLYGASLLLCPPLSKAEDATGYEVVRIISRVSGTCGSGVLLSGGQILTTAHTAEQICAEYVCKNLQITHSSGEEVSLTKTPAKLKTSVRSLDIALIELPEKIYLGDGITVTEPPVIETQEDIVVAGFPRCGQFEVTTGTITQRKTLHWSTSAQGSPGSSGSGVFTTNGRFVGLIDEAATFSGMLSYELFGRSFALKLVPGKTIAALLSGDFEDSLTQEAIALKEFYVDEVVDKKGWNRLFASDQFLGLVDKLRLRLAREQISSNSSLSKALLLSTGFPGHDLLVLLKLADTVPEPIMTLVIYAMLEANGLTASPLHQLKRATVESLIKRSSISGEMVADISSTLSRFTTSRYQGFNLMTITTCLTASILLLALGALWGGSLGYVWRDLADVSSLFFKAWTMLLVGFAFWPLSFLIYRVRSRIRNKKA